MKRTYKEIQESDISKFDDKKLYSLDMEVINQPTLTLIHQTSRFWYFKKGEGKISINNKTFDIKDNTMAIILPWDTTKIVSVNKPFHLIKIVFNVDFVNNYRLFNISNNKMPLSLLDSTVITLNKQQKNEVEHIIKNIKNYTGIDSFYKNDNNQLISDTYVALKLNELFLLFLSIRTNSNLIIANQEEQDKKDVILKYIYSHVSTISLSQLSNVVNISESAISKYISSQTGKSFSEIVKQIKIDKTIDLLIHTDLTMSEISQIIGFSDDKHLISIFEKEKGVSPKKYRQLYQVESKVYKRKSEELGYRVIDYINNHYSDDINEISLTRYFDVSINKINAALLNITEMNLTSFINYIRINKACVELLKTDNSIIDIGENVGFHSTKTFTRYFFKYKEMTPSDFRENVYLQKGSESLPENE